MLNNIRKSHVIVNIRDLNAITQINVYSLSLQTNFIALIEDCRYINVVDYVNFFY